ncbi:YtfJ family protein [Vibrio sp. S4M6]|uniref:YtfJ family protein n=1 Tax=Vibrio sinus TaxID=2946865 RepID=UPI002029E564|nr:YtfJ family protein [Vibrio sinus]MCL9780495.1 YtfJ family protein [Vibrio sinus]
MKFNLLKPIITALACLPLFAVAKDLTVGQPLPSVTVKDYGEIMLKNGDESYQPWSTSALPGKVRVIQAIAGRSSAKKMNQPLMKAITASKFPEDKYQTTTIVNQDDAMWGTGSMVKSSAEDSKKEYPWSSIVVDEYGVVAKAWDLKQESSAIVVVNKEGKVLFEHQGALDQTQIEQVIKLVKNNLGD